MSAHFYYEKRLNVECFSHTFLLVFIMIINNSLITIREMKMKLHPGMRGMRYQISIRSGLLFSFCSTLTEIT